MTTSKGFRAMLTWQITGRHAFVPFLEQVTQPIKKKTPKNNFYLWLTWKVFCVTCHVKNRFESQTKATDFHGILHFDAITDQTDASPIFFGKFRVVAGIKCWTLNTSKGI